MNPKTVAKWLGQALTTDAPMGPKSPKFTVPTSTDETRVIEVRHRTLLSLDDVLGYQRDTILNLSRPA